MLEEAEKSMISSYNEGYKQAKLELQPEIDVLHYRLNTKEQNKVESYITTATISFGLGCLIGGLTGFGLTIKLKD